MTPVVLVAHGSADPRAAATTRALARSVAAARAGLDVRVAFLDHGGPRPDEVLFALQAAGYRSVVVVPLLLTAAYHGRVDLPAVVRSARRAGLTIEVVQTQVLGPSDGVVVPALLDGLRRRLAEATPDGGGIVPAGGAGVVPVGGEGIVSAGGGGIVPSGGGGVVPVGGVAAAVGGVGAAGPIDGIVLAAAGTRDVTARETVDLVARRLADSLGLPCVVGYASAAAPTGAEATRVLRADGAQRIAVAAYFLACGRLYDTVVNSAMSAGAIVAAAPLGSGREVAELILHRVDVAKPVASPA